MINSRFRAVAILLSLCAVNAFAAPPTPPEGYQWVINEDYTDEFEGAELDREKWLDYYPGWEGRPPAKFVPEAISVRDGSLRIQAGVLDEPQGENREYTLSGGAVQSRKMGALYGYYECRMKASSISMSSTFWMKNKHDDAERPFMQTELDVQEAIGNAKTWTAFKTHIKSNTHISYFGEDESQDKHGQAVNNTAKLKSAVDEEFHTYGVWWIDANTMKFYADGEYLYTIHPSTEFDETPFDQPMFVNMVCETYDWEELPTMEELTDDTRNTAYYDYVRAYTLEKVGE